MSANDGPGRCQRGVEKPVVEVFAEGLCRHRGGEIAAADGSGGGIARTEIEITTIGDYDSSFLRGDAHGDGRIRLSDAVGALTILFAGAEPPRCHEGAQIPSPYPAPGLDPTPDELGC